ncbi:diguanylate phosphodiesterase [Vibrio sp. ZSDZ65]|uniref:Diguanylate phosphodiesterase n=1 Tax=Vibrio qingdaonensis TaxID=2829491 RepID=A0A9X3HWH4_9VIBR|nr:diguanylate phosphodiesterase [Vibrio qingdaonensis]MCW8346640.1 diguanylate phosphodiesterase [Vibrio qingdaonensis]
MDNLTSNQALYYYLSQLIGQHVVTEDDQLIFSAFEANDIHHACQAIRDTNSGDIEYQHLTLRFGSHSEQSVYQFDLSTSMRFCLDLYSLYLAVRQTKFQIETFHPDLISNVVVPISHDALLWQQGQFFLKQIIRFHAGAFYHIIPSLQLSETSTLHPDTQPLSDTLKEYAYALWFDISPSQMQLDRLLPLAPDAFKVAVTIESKQDRSALLPLVRFCRLHKIKWVAGRICSQEELTQFKRLGASYYFGYFSDLPTAMSFKSFGDAHNEVM